ncbi:MAG TPA: helix-turn-helix domain-containing protein [Pyrinomonadaceae bacterium]
MAIVARRRHPQQSTLDDDQVILFVTHEELARLAALSRQRVTITMGKLRRRGLVQYERNRPLVVDVPALTAYLTN